MHTIILGFVGDAKKTIKSVLLQIFIFSKVLSDPCKILFL